MDPFLNLPDELIIKLCNDMETPDLLNTAEASSKVYQVCSDIIEERKLYDLINYIKSEKLPQFKKEFPGFTIYVMVNNYDPKYIRIVQFTDGSGETIKNIPWVLSGNIPLLTTFLGVRTLDTENINDELIIELAKNLIDQGYTKSQS